MRPRILTIWAFVILIASSTAYGQAPKLRLAEVQDVNPSSYQIDLTLDPARDTFTGSIVIQLEIRKPLHTLWLNQQKTTVRTTSLKAAGKTTTAKALPGGDDFVGFQFDSPIPAGSAELAINYSGVIVTNSTAAIFRRTDRDKAYLFTQFEATDARGAFPCFDEPSYKTPWQLTLHVPAGDTAISNTGIASEKDEGGTRTVVFRQTRPLPSYLVAFGVGPFEFVDAGTAGRNHVPVRIVVPEGHTAEAKYAAQITGEIISRHEQYFGIPYPYDKADQVAVPEFPGAMENPGMVTYGQTLILSRPETDSINRQRLFAVVAAHELAHQWFGDLVTTAWWNDIWLNEAFATWMEQKFIADWKPEWKTRVRDVDAKLVAEREDSLISARRVRQPIESKDDINNAFDAITYDKGAAVIGMFERWIGPGEFQKGVQDYMKRYAFKATTSDDFLGAIGQAAHRDVSKAFSAFLDQPGVPVVSVRLACEPGGPATLHLEQRRFVPLGSKGSADQVWQVPICIRYGNGDTGERACTLLTEPAAEWKLKANSCPAWVEANDDALGYYRVDYQGGLLQSLTQGAVDRRLTATERVDFMGNAQALSSAGKLPVADALGLVSTFHADSERHVVQTALDLALSPRSRLVPGELMPQYRRFLLQNFQARAHELGWVPTPGEPDDIRLLRPRLVQAVATWGGDQEFARRATELADKWLQDRQSVDPNMLDAVLGTAAFYGDKGLFNRFLANFKNTQDKQLRGQLVRAMGSFRDPAAIEAGMNALVAGDVPFTEGGGLLFAGLDEPSTRRRPFEFVKAHFDQIVARMPTGGTFDFGTALPHVGDSFCDEASRSELQAFFQPLVERFAGAPRTLNQVLERIDLCIAMKGAQQPGVVSFLRNF